MNVEDGWRFYTADFSCQAHSIDASRLGAVMLSRDPADRARWHRMPQEMKDDEDGPELYVIGRGMTFEDALVNANLAAAHARPIPDDTE